MTQQRESAGAREAVSQRDQQVAREAASAEAEDPHAALDVGLVVSRRIHADGLSGGTWALCGFRPVSSSNCIVVAAARERVRTDRPERTGQSASAQQQEAEQQQQSPVQSSQRERLGQLWVSRQRALPDHVK